MKMFIVTMFSLIFFSCSKENNPPSNPVNPDDTHSGNVLGKIALVKDSIGSTLGYATAIDDYAMNLYTSAGYLIRVLWTGVVCPDGNFTSFYKAVDSSVYAANYGNINSYFGKSAFHAYDGLLHTYADTSSLGYSIPDSEGFTVCHIWNYNRSFDTSFVVSSSQANNYYKLKTVTFAQIGLPAIIHPPLKLIFN